MIPLSGPRKLIGFFALFVLAAFSASFLLSSRDEGATRSYYDRLSSRTSFRGALNKEQLAITEAGNRTLGFHKLYFVNLPKRYDRSDVGGMQAFLSGIQLEPYLAVDAATLSDLGMPPTSNPGFLSKPKLACYRAHANVSPYPKLLQQLRGKLTGCSPHRSGPKFSKNDCPQSLSWKLTPSGTSTSARS
jgi:hypothetical protein